MYFSTIWILMGMLSVAGGWMQPAKMERWKAYAAFGFGGILLVLTFLPPFQGSRVSIYAAENILLLVLLVTQHPAHPARMLFLAMIGGLAGWKLTDWFPLFPEQGLLMILPSILLMLAIRQDRAAERLQMAITPYFAMLCVTLMDQFLFRYSVLSIGTPDGLSATLVGIFAAEGKRMAETAWRNRNMAIRRRSGIPGKENMKF